MMANTKSGQSQRTPVWRQPLPVLFMFLVWFLFLYRETAMGMVTVWARSETFTHGFLVPPIVLWLVWRQRQVLAAEMPHPNFWGLLPLAGAALLWFLGELAVVNVVTQLAFVAMLVLSVPVVLGVPIALRMIFPLGFLFFAVPLGEFLLPQLMEWTASFTVLALRLTGVPVYREGLQFVIPSGHWSVVEACSGVRYLIASFMVGTLFAYLNYRSTKRRLIFSLVSLLVPLLANWMRAYLIVMLGHLSGNKIAAGVDHLIYGWLFFGVVIMLMMFIGARWTEPESESEMRNMATGEPLQKVPGALIAGALAAAMMVSLPQGAAWLIDRPDSTGRPHLAAPDSLSAGWVAKDRPPVDFKPAFQNPLAEVSATYSHQGHDVGLYLGYYRHQDSESKLVSSANVLVTSEDPHWSQVAGGSRIVSIGGQPVKVSIAELRGTSWLVQSRENRLIVWKIYWVNGTLTASDYLAKVYSVFYRLMGRGDDSAVIVLYKLKDAAGADEAFLELFLTNNYGAIDQLLRKAVEQK